MISFVLDKSVYKSNCFDELLDKCIARRLAYIKTIYNPSDLTKAYKHYKKTWSEGVSKGKMILLYNCYNYKFRTFAVVILPDKWSMDKENKMLVSDLTFSGVSADFARNEISNQWVRYDTNTLGGNTGVPKSLYFTACDDIEYELDLFDIDWTAYANANEGNIPEHLRKIAGAIK